MIMAFTILMNIEEVGGGAVRMVEERDFVILIRKLGKR